MEARSKVNAIPVVTDPEHSARLVGLRYVTDETPGIHRTGSGKGFRYTDSSGKAVQDEPTLARIKSLVIPPAWKGVWICPFENGHLQATGVDARGRKQYRYHKRWREVRDETKYNRMILFGKALPKIRQRVENDLGAGGLPRNKVLATIVRLMDTNHIRVGNEEYARDNKSYGLTTMRDKHAQVNGASIRLKFRGKSAKEHVIDIEDAQLARIVKKCQDLPGQELFQFVNGDGKVQDIKSEDVNGYLKEISGEEFTAKDFRTWAGTVLAAQELCCAPQCETQRQIKKVVVRAVEVVAARLGNTPAVCRKSYVHPAIFETFQSGTILEVMSVPVRRKSKPPKNGLSSEEKCVLHLLQKHVADRQEPLDKKLQRSLVKLKLERSSRRRVR